MNTNGLVAAVKSLAGHSTADLIGIAPGDASSAEELGELGQAFGPVRAVVVLAQHIVDPVQMARFHNRPGYQESEISTSYGDAMLRDACWRVVEVLRRAGRKAAIPQNQRYCPGEPTHQLSYKRAGALAGLGAFGRNQLLLHPTWGPWMLLRTVITDAPLRPDAPLAASPCSDCKACFAACPRGALSTAGIDRARCEASLRELGVVGGGAHSLSPQGRINCEECLRACPVGPAPPRLGQ